MLTLSSNLLLGVVQGPAVSASPESWLGIQVLALASVAQLLGVSPYNGKFAGLIPGQDMGLGCGSNPWSGHVRSPSGACGRQPLCVSFSHQCFSLSLPLSKGNEKIPLDEDKIIKIKIANKRNVSSWAPSQTYEIRICILTRFPTIHVHIIM